MATEPAPAEIAVTSGERVADGEPTLSWAAATDVGRVRRHNEDAILAEPPSFVVADGMGGHEAGDVASALAITRLAGLGPGLVEVDDVAAELRRVNTLLREAAGGGDTTMGTTCVGVIEIRGAGAPSWLVFNVGDSRAYCLVDGVLVRLSRDHSFVQQLVDAGEITAEEATTHRQRNVITRALGVDDDAGVDYWIRPVTPGERFLLCSDGLSGEVDDRTLASVLGSGAAPAAAVEELVTRALEAGGRDNVSAVVVDVVSVPGWDDVTTGGRGRVEVDTGRRSASTDDEAEIDTGRRVHGAPTGQEAEIDTAERPVRGDRPTESPAGAPVTAPIATSSPPHSEMISWVPPVDRAEEPAPRTEADAAISDVPIVERTAEEIAPEPEPVALITAMPESLASAETDTDAPADADAPAGADEAGDADPSEVSDRTDPSGPPAPPDPPDPPDPGDET